MEHGLPLLEASGTSLYLPLTLSFQLNALVALGRFDKAAAVVREIDRRIEASAERWNESDIRRIEGDLRLAQGAADGAERCYRQALTIAGEQKAKAFELRAATALARLLAERGKRQIGYDLLAPVYGWFSEGLDLPDLKDARALLDEFS